MAGLLIALVIAQACRLATTRQIIIKDGRAQGKPKIASMYMYQVRIRMLGIHSTISTTVLQSHIASGSQGNGPSNGQS